MSARLAPLALLLALAACKSSPYCLNCERSDGGDGSGGGGDASIDGMDDLTGVVEDGGNDTDLHPCDSSRLGEDPFNCGACGKVCPHAHAIPACVGGACTVKQCDVGWIDLDHSVVNDCEYACLPTGGEVCDHKDNDCNGVVDDGFDTSVDPLNCGDCGVSCTAANAVATCAAGHCQIAGCTAGYADLDPSADGCEYHCPVYPPLTFESCNGLDDNCDGAVDEPAHLESPPMSLCSTAPSTPCAGTVPICATRSGVTTWYCNYGAGVEFNPNVPNGIVTQETKCDGFDGDCDGIPDDPWPSLGATCDNGALGACRDAGQVKCDPVDSTKTYCDFSVLPDPIPGSPKVETCNNVDDDCDGLVDERSGGNRLVQDMVHVVAGGLDFYIDRYEASRPDADVNGMTAGIVQTTSCSKQGALPWTQVPFATAQAACTAAGLRLCTAAEWGMACAGTAPRTYPYGNMYQGATCNGADFAASHAILPTGDPSTAMCLSPTNVRDMSGNAKEWTNDQQGMTSGAMPQPIYVVRGGAYGSPSVGLTCATTFSQASADTSLPDIGFRCCSTTAP